MTETLMARPAEHVDKPWGFEEIVAIVEGLYVGKLLHVTAGRALSLQWHHHKDETLIVLSGAVEMDLGWSQDDLSTITVPPGKSVHVAPGLLHRVRTLADAVLVETSTAGPGWRDDIVRLEDLYGRAGTHAP